MSNRFVSIWFRHLTTDWFTIRNPALKTIPFVLAAPDHGRMKITAVNTLAQAQGIETGITVADARVLIPTLQVLDDKPDLPEKLLTSIGKWCIRYTPVAAIDPPGGLILDASGCTHLWGGEKEYLDDIVSRLKSRGYNVRAAMADTIGAAWAVARFGKTTPVIPPGEQQTALLSLPPAALRLDLPTLLKLHKLGIFTIGRFIHIEGAALRRRFGKEMLLKLHQALGYEEEVIQPLQVAAPCHERLPCLEPIVTATGIEIALKQLLATLCTRLQQEGKGLRKAVFKGYRADGKVEQLETGTNRPSNNAAHLFKLFEIIISRIEPGPGIELFILEAPVTEDASPFQESLWGGAGSLEDINVAELLDRLGGRIGAANIHRYLPLEHYWPERSVKPAASLREKPTTAWRVERPRPINLLPVPEPVEVTAPIPDYPPMLFLYKGKRHKIIKADGPERIEREWWIEKGEHRDYYTVEDEEGRRYWLFRSGHYTGNKSTPWFIHGFYA